MANRASEIYYSSGLSLNLYAPYVKRIAEGLSEYPQTLTCINPPDGSPSPHYFIWSGLLFQFNHNVFLIFYLA